MVNIKNIILGIAIMILTIFVVVYGINTIYLRPDYQDFCGDKTSVGDIQSEQECAAVGGNWTSYAQAKSTNEVIREGWCDLYSECQKEYDAAREKYSRNLFLITLPLGIILIAVGVFIFGLEVVGAGFAGGGVLTLLWGVIEYWQYGSNLLKFLLSLIGLVIVIWLAYWFNKKK